VAKVHKSPWLPQLTKQIAEPTRQHLTSTRGSLRPLILKASAVR